MATPIDGYAVADWDGNIYYVVGTRQPYKGLYAYPRFVPSEGGGRGGFRKLSIPEAVEYARGLGLRMSTVFGSPIPVLPMGMVSRVYDPVERAGDIVKEPRDEAERDAAALILALSRVAEVDPSGFGVTGSMLVGLHRPGSDIDLTYFGGLSDPSRALKVYRGLRRMRRMGMTSPLSGEALRRIVRERWGGVGRGFEELEGRKVLQGMFRDRVYGVKLLSRFPEPDKVVRRVRVRGSVVNPPLAHLFPARYRVKAEDGVYLVISFRTRFCEQAEVGEEVVAEGYLEANLRNVVISYDYGFIAPVGLMDG